MPKHTSTKDAEQAVEKASAALEQAKRRGLKGKELEGYKRDLANAKATLAGIQKAFKASQKG